MNKQQVNFCWPFTAPSGKELQMTLFSDGTAELFDLEGWAEANKNKRPEYKFIHYLLDERSRLPFTFKIRIPFDLYCRIRQASLDLDKGVQVSPPEVRDINVRVTEILTNDTVQTALCALSLQHGLVPKPKPQPTDQIRR